MASCHCAATGRLSSSDPNASEHPLDPNRPGWSLHPRGSLRRGSRQSARRRRTTTRSSFASWHHMSQDEALKSAFAQGLDIHTETAAEVFGVPASQLVPEMRRVAKAINFRIAYGLSAFGLAQRLELPSSEAQSTSLTATSRAFTACAAGSTPRSPKPATNQPSPRSSGGGVSSPTSTVGTRQCDRPPSGWP